ncbi:hypothetical protein MNBD_ALPHA06-1875 [hydrothermal vent metagenome]|uniref:DUF302 domain-containing protein n=1 Tax=hydrothermal vent metagenome TaxID=652676 RepID=A0A3B0RP01_9ZZZZ
MSYCFTKTVSYPWAEALDRTNAALANHGFGVLTSIDVQATLKKKLDADMPKYTILGACNPKMAHKAIETEPRIGILLPCNVILRETGDAIEISVVDAAASMQSVENPELPEIAGKVTDMLQAVLQEI